MKDQKNNVLPALDRQAQILVDGIILTIGQVYLIQWTTPTDINPCK